MGIAIFATVWSLLVGAILYFLYGIIKYFIDLRRRGRAVNQFPGDPRHWLWGNIHDHPGHTEDGLAYERHLLEKYPQVNYYWRGNFFGPCLWVKHPETVKEILKTAGPNEAGLEYIRKKSARFPRLFGTWRGPFHPALIVRHPETVKEILKSAEPKPMGIGLYRHGLPWLGDGLLLGGGKKWARNRRLLTPAFHFDILRGYISIKNQAVEVLLNKMLKAAESGSSFEVFSNISLCTLDVILRCAFSYENDCQVKGETHPYVQAVHTLSDLWVQRTLNPLLYSDLIYYMTSNGRRFKKHCDFVHSVSADIIANRKRTLEEQGESAMRSGKTRDFLDVLLTARDEDGEGLSDLEIRNEVDTFLFAGHDTTASSISWTLYSLAKHPEHQDKCREEIDEVLSKRQTPHILWEDLSKLEHLTLCIKEAMRLHCPVPFIERMTTKEIEIDGKQLPPRSIIDVQIYALHHNQTVWDNPMEYQPERFLTKNMESMDAYAFVPFSAGPRNCIGQNFAMNEQKVLIGRILHRFILQLDPNHKVEKKIGVVMRTQTGIKMKLTPRQ